MTFSIYYISRGSFHLTISHDNGNYYSTSTNANKLLHFLFHYRLLKSTITIVVLKIIGSGQEFDLNFFNIKNYETLKTFWRFCCHPYKESKESLINEFS